MQHDPSPSHIRLELSGVPSSGYSAEQLADAADDLLREIEDLLNLNAALAHSKLGYRLCDRVDQESGTVKRFVQLHLIPKPRLQADLFGSWISVDQLESILYDDRQTLVNLFRKAPQVCDVARVRFAERVASAVMNVESEQLPPLDLQLLSALRARRNELRGSVCGHGLQLRLPDVGLDWDSAPVAIRARIERRGGEGYWLKPLGAVLPVRASARLKMDFPQELEVSARLDRATLTGKPESLLVRIGRKVDSGEADCADFLEFCDQRDRCDAHVG
jgi:hypothetical protein